MRPAEDDRPSDVARLEGLARGRLLVCVLSRLVSPVMSVSDSSLPVAYVQIETKVELNSDTDDSTLADLAGRLIAITAAHHGTVVKWSIRPKPTVALRRAINSLVRQFQEHPLSNADAATLLSKINDPERFPLQHLIPETPDELQQVMQGVVAIEEDAEQKGKVEDIARGISLGQAVTKLTPWLAFLIALCYLLYEAGTPLTSRQEQVFTNRIAVMALAAAVASVIISLSNK
jgi:hypothetical protein